MKRQATIPYIADICSATSEQLRETLQQKGAILTIDSHNWSADYPYFPEVVARVAYTDTALAVMFDVSEKHTMAVTLSDNGPVWEDSCVEFFVANPCAEGYFNFELNAIGSLLAAYRLSRDNAVHFSAEKLQSVIRYGSLEHKSIDIRHQNSWWAAMIIPFSLINLSEPPKTLRANLYKCGDKLCSPHFLSWSKVELEKPNFHSPQFFGELTFDYE